jgi:hypothetical protein
VKIGLPRRSAIGSWHAGCPEIQPFDIRKDAERSWREGICVEESMRDSQLLLDVLEEGYWKKAWHGPNLKQSLKGVTAKQAAWRPAAGRHNIWEEALHAAYWKYDVRRVLEGGKRGSFVLKGSNFFARPENGKLTDAAWRTDKEILETEHERLRDAVKKALKRGAKAKVARLVYGVAFHDIYHTGQIRLLRRLQEAD